MPKDSCERWNKRNKRLRVENDYNRVLREYLLIKHAPIAEEFSTFYDSLRKKYPEKHCYKGSKSFRTWVRTQIEQDDVEKNTTETTEEQNVSEQNGVEKNTTETTEEQNVSEAATLGGIVADDVPEAASLGGIVADDVPEAAALGGIVDDVIGEIVVGPTPLENIIANGRQEELEELDVLIGNIIADLESQCDEGIALSPHHEIEAEPLYYDGEIEGLDDIEFDLPLDRLELELENF